MKASLRKVPGVPGNVMMLTTGLSFGFSKDLILFLIAATSPSLDNTSKVILATVPLSSQTGSPTAFTSFLSTFKNLACESKYNFILNVSLVKPVTDIVIDCFCVHKELLSLGGHITNLSHLSPLYCGGQAPGASTTIGSPFLDLCPSLYVTKDIL